MKYYARVALVKEFQIEFPEKLFSDEHMKNIREYCEAYRDITPESLKHEIIEAYADGGDGYYEQFGCYIGWRHWLGNEYDIFVKISDEDVYVDENYLEEA